MSTPDPIIIDLATSKIAWDDATKNTDGSDITSTEVTSFTVGVRDTTATGSAAGSYPYSITAPATATSTLLSALGAVLPKGLPLVGAIKENTATAADPTLPSSDWSVETVPFLIPKPAPVPMPPTNPTVA